ncbi:MAG: glycosyltransferase family 2 protein [Candidatus Pelagibacter sp.]
MLSIIIPVYNEINTIEKIIDQINSLNFIKKEIIVVDDFSTDGTKELIEQRLVYKINKVFYHKENKGKGAAIQSAKKLVSGDYIIIQDADLEYDPNDYEKLLKPILNKEYEVVYGSRVLGKNRYYQNNFYSNLRVFFNHALTIFSNILNNQRLTDAHTCYKVFTKDLFDKIILKENSFSFCPEVTTKIANLGIKIKEVPINYNGRTYNEGKKIRFIDGIIAIRTLIQYRFFK